MNSSGRLENFRAPPPKKNKTKPRGSAPPSTFGPGRHPHGQRHGAPAVRPGELAGQGEGDGAPQPREPHLGLPAAWASGEGRGSVRIFEVGGVKPKPRKACC